MWAKRLLIVSALAGLIVLVRIALFGIDSPVVLLLLVGLCTAWAVALGAALLAGLAISERFRKKAPTVVGTALPGLLVTAAGAGLCLALLSLQIVGFNADTLALAVAGGAVAVASAIYRHRLSRSFAATIGLLAFVVIGFNAPREGGLFSLHWNSSSTDVSLQWNGGENCAGSNLGDRATAIAPYRPDYVIISQLEGPLGERINETLGQAPLEDQYRPGVAQIRLTGRLDHGGLPCYLPLFKSDAVNGSITSQTNYRWSEDNGANLSCTASHTLSYEATIDSSGVASCHDLSKELAKQIVQHLHNHAKSICGH